MFTFRDEKCHGGKLNKERVTSLLEADMIGTTKLQIVDVIGKSVKPRCFRRAKCRLIIKTTKRIDDIFEMWLLKLDKSFLHQNQKVLFIIENCPA